MNEHTEALLQRVLRRITNPQMNERQKITYAGESLKCMMIVSDKWQIPAENVLEIIERLEQEEVPMFLDDDEYKELDDEHKIFWDFVTEMEPFDMIPGKDQREE